MHQFYFNFQGLDGVGVGLISHATMLALVGTGVALLVLGLLFLFFLLRRKYLLAAGSAALGVLGVLFYFGVLLAFSLGSREQVVALARGKIFLRPRLPPGLFGGGGGEDGDARPAGSAERGAGDLLRGMPQGTL